MAEVTAPGTPEELALAVTSALAEERPLEVLGAGSKRGLGRPVDGLMPLSLERLAGTLFYEPEELVMSARAGTPLSRIEADLAECRQQLAFEPADYAAILGGPPGSGTIGGLFACNLAGPRRIKAGAARDHLLGARAVTGRGDAVATGGRVVKNVTGYDLCKLLAGSYGTLAVMTEVTFKVLPAPEETRTLLAAGRDEPALLAALRYAMAAPYDVAGAALIPGDAAARSRVGEVKAAARSLAAIRLEGHGPSVAYRADALKEQLGRGGAELAILEGEASLALWREVRDVALLPRQRALWRVSLPPEAAAAFAEELSRQLAFDALYDWAGGLAWLAVEAQGDGGALAVRAALAPSGGHATLIRAPEALRASVPVFQPQPAALGALSARVKDSFDPGRILNPGRMYDGV